jgi:hypothetical protein
VSGSPNRWAKKLLMRCYSRFILLLFALLIVVGLCILFGRYPTTGISNDTIAISVSDSAKDSSTFTLTDAEDLREAKEIAGTIWNHLGHNSMDDRPMYRITLTKSDQSIESFWVTPREWSNHGLTPDGFTKLIERKKPN